MAPSRREPGPIEGGLAFVEFASEDPAATRAFLEKTFGWKFRSVSMPMGEYLSYDSPTGRGGIRPVQPKEGASSLSYVRVSNLDEARRRVESSGGSIVLPRVDIPGMGSFFWFRAPGGPLLACWQDPPPVTGTGTEEK